MTVLHKMNKGVQVLTVLHKMNKGVQVMTVLHKMNKGVQVMTVSTQNPAVYALRGTNSLGTHLDECVSIYL